MGEKFIGRHDTFEVVCSECEAGIQTTPVIEPMIQGEEVECSRCGASGIVYDDGGIYKLSNADERLNISLI